jgi:hypothetical protein
MYFNVCAQRTNNARYLPFRVPGAMPLSQNKVVIRFRFRVRVRVRVRVRER